MYFRRTDCLDFARMEDVQCLLDFSNGPNAMVLKTVKVDPTSNLVLPETEDKRVYADLDGSPPSFAAMTEPGSSKIVCTYCGKSFGHRGDYNKHLRRHTGERPYSCTKCPQTFSLSSNLKRHEKLHSGETPFKCHRCEKMFSRKDKLTAHEKRKRCGDELNKSPAR